MAGDKGLLVVVLKGKRREELRRSENSEKEVIYFIWFWGV